MLGLGLSIVAEGVERPGQAQFFGVLPLRLAGLAQGQDDGKNKNRLIFLRRPVLVQKYK
jgi:hypothetical protein